MPAIIRSVRGRYSSEKIIEKSRFLSYCDHVASEEEARAFIAEIKAPRGDPSLLWLCRG